MKDAQIGTAQVMDYGHRLANRYRNLRLKKFVVTALGFERICFHNADVLEEWKSARTIHESLL